MNNSIIIKNADFSGCKIDDVTIEKLTITKDGNGFIKANANGDLEVVTESTWDPQYECAYSEQITLPAGTRALYGMTNILCNTATFLAWLASPTGTTIQGATVPTFVYHDTDTNKWVNYMRIYYGDVANRPNIIKYKSGLYVDELFTAVLTDGPIYGQRFAANFDKICVNWFRTDSRGASEVGIMLPEFYAYIES